MYAIHGDVIDIAYAGKHQQAQRHVLSMRGLLSDRGVEQRVAEKVLILAREKRQHLFTQENGKPFTPDMVNDYFTARQPDPDRDLPVWRRRSSLYGPQSAKLSCHPDFHRVCP